MGLDILEEYIFSMGNWHSIEEMEEHLTIEELHRLFIAKQKADYETKQFTAALKGIQMDPYEDPYEKTEKSDYDEVKRRADIRRKLIMQGKNPEDYANIEEMENATELDDLMDIGFGIEEV